MSGTRSWLCVCLSVCLSNCITDWISDWNGYCCCFCCRTISFLWNVRLHWSSLVSPSQECVFVSDFVVVVVVVVVVRDHLSALSSSVSFSLNQTAETASDSSAVFSVLLQRVQRISMFASLWAILFPTLSYCILCISTPQFAHTQISRALIAKNNSHKSNSGNWWWWWWWWW